MLRRLLFFTLLLVAPFTAVLANPLYGQAIYAPGKSGAELRQAINDLSFYLQQITGKAFPVRPAATENADGIHLVIGEHPSLTASQRNSLRGSSIESFVLAATSNRLLIVANHPLGLSHGIYTYLDQLGVRWFLPGAEWTQVPSLSDIRVRQSGLVTPSTRLRNFSGTGGLRPLPPLDPSGQLQQDWDAWKRRNRMGGSIQLGGHYGEVFNLKHRKVLEANPRYLALVNGRRGPWEATVKWCYSQPGLRRLFVADRLAELETALASREYKNEPVTLSVDPADGGGDCTCDDCRKLGSLSDRIFGLANEVAQAFARRSNQASVSLFGYNTHAAPPSRPLEPNVVVAVTPYAFQDWGSPEALIAAWRKKHSNLLIYDYYGIPDWHLDVPMPQKTSPDTLVSRIQLWTRQGYDGFLLESSFSGALTGPGLYLAAQLGWDRQANLAARQQEFHRFVFGQAGASSARQFFELLLRRYRGLVDLPRLIDLVSAIKLSDPLAVRRLASLKAYLHYLVLQDEVQAATEAQRPAAVDNLMQYAYQIYPLRMVHSTRLTELLYYPMPAGSAAARDWHIYEPYGRRLQAIRPITVQQVEALWSENRKRFPVLEGFGAGGSTASPVAYRIKSTARGQSELLLLSFPETFVKAPANGKIRLEIRLNSETLDKEIRVKLVDSATGVLLTDRVWKAGKEWRTLELSAPAGKVLRLEMQFSPWILLRVPATQWIGFASIPTYSVMGPLHVYVPPGTPFLYYSNKPESQPEFVNPGGQSVKPEPVGSKQLYRVPVGKAAGWWTIRATEYKFLQFYELSSLLFLHPNYEPERK
jgi:hypothetical protein